MGLKKWLTEEKEHGSAWMCPKCGAVRMSACACAKHIERKHGK